MKTKSTYEVIDVDDEDEGRKNQEIINRFKRELKADSGFIILRQGQNLIAEIRGSGEELVNILIGALGVDEELRKIFTLALMHQQKV